MIQMKVLLPWSLLACFISITDATSIIWALFSEGDETLLVDPRKLVIVSASLSMCLWSCAWALAIIHYPLVGVVSRTVSLLFIGLSIFAVTAGGRSSYLLFWGINRLITSTWLAISSTLGMRQQ